LAITSDLQDFFRVSVGIWNFTTIFTSLTKESDAWEQLILHIGFDFRGSSHPYFLSFSNNYLPLSYKYLDRCDFNRRSKNPPHIKNFEDSSSLLRTANCCNFSSTTWIQ
jgi:hypothetical protein